MSGHTKKRKSYRTRRKIRSKYSNDINTSRKNKFENKSIDNNKKYIKNFDTNKLNNAAKVYINKEINTILFIS